MGYGIDPAAWPAELRQRHLDALSAWAEIGRLRARSNAIEAIAVLPEDVGTETV